MENESRKCRVRHSGSHVCINLFYAIFYMVFHECISYKKEKGNRNLCIYGIDESKNREVIYDRGFDDRPFITALGLGVGTLTARLFQMIMMKLSDITVEVFNSISLKSILTVSACYVVIYVIFAVKGYVNIVRSSVLEMISASRKNEYVRQHPVILLVKTVLGVAALSTGYYLAIVKGGMEVFRNTLSAVVFVTIGVYLVFGGLIPIIFQGITKRKSFLYKKQRTLWVNNIVFRMKRNYRTYAIVSVLMLCSVTALAAGFAMKERYDGWYTSEILTHIRC